METSRSEGGGGSLGIGIAASLRAAGVVRSPINRSIGRQPAIAPAPNAKGTIQLMGGQMVDRAIELENEESNSDSEGESQCEPLTLSLDERRQVVELLKKTDEESSTSRTTFGWLRSYLGI